MSLSPRRWRMLFIAGTVMTACFATLSLSLAQTKTTGFNEREVEPQLHAFDKADNWTLNFRFKDPRIISCDVPGYDKKKIVWYMIYQVINNTSEPRTIVPELELKTHDYETVHAELPSPSVQEYISKIEDPTGKLKIFNSFTISENPIPMSKKDAFPRAVTGIAMWADVYDRAPKTNRFSIFITGLSDGYRSDPKSDIIRRKTLQLNFQRLGDEIQNDAGAIRFVDSTQWIYRATDAKLTGMPKKEGAIIEPIKEEPKEKSLRPMFLPLPRENIVLPPRSGRPEKLP